MSYANEKMEAGEPPVVVVPSEPVVVTAVATPHHHHGVVVNNNNVVPMYQQEKLGAKCCGCCCDYRRAVIVVAIIFIVANALTLIFAIIGQSYVIREGFDDDVAQQYWDDNNFYNIIVSSIGLVMAIVGLVGARLYNVPLLGLAVVWFFVNYGITVYFNVDYINNVNNNLADTEPQYRMPIGLFVVQFFITCLWVYPYGGLIMEIRQGIMSYETYPREEYSCCCVERHYHH